MATRRYPVIGVGLDWIYRHPAHGVATPPCQVYLRRTVDGKGEGPKQRSHQARSSHFAALFAAPQKKGASSSASVLVTLLHVALVDSNPRRLGSAREGSRAVSPPNLAPIPRSRCSVVVWIQELLAFLFLDLPPAMAALVELFLGSSSAPVDWEAEAYPACGDFAVLPFLVAFFPAVRFLLGRLVFEVILMVTAAQPFFGSEKPLCNCAVAMYRDCCYLVVAGTRLWVNLVFSC
jgi:hypothetical protein